jgi:23S rRNA pseudouridine1911/1915/1917 synthase
VRLVDHAKAHLVVVPVGEIGGLITRGAITVNGRPARIADPVGEGDVVVVDPAALAAHALRPQPLPLVIVHEDDDLLICNKPAGMHVHPLGAHREGTLLNALLWHCGARPDQPWASWRPRPLHRLDRAASGLVAIAKRAAVHDSVRLQFADHAIERRYHAVVEGRVAGDAGTIDAPLGRDPACDYRRAIVPVEQGGQPAVTHWTVLARCEHQTLVEVVLATGRTHQIRAHLASAGHPIVGDALYARTGSRGDAASVIALHAVELALRHPCTGERLVYSAPCLMKPCERC